MSSHSRHDPPAAPARPASPERPAPTGRLIHDAVALDRGLVSTGPVAGALTPAMRAERLAHVGLHVGDVVGTPTHRLSLQRPYQPSPEAWLDAYAVDVSTGPGVDRLWWRLPSSFPTEFWPAVNLTFADVAAGPQLVSIAIEVWPYPGATGTVVIDIGARRTEVPIGVAAARIIDVVVTHGGGMLSASVFVRPGLYDLVFRSATLGPPPPVLVAEP